ncbi:MAG: hypothetical protein R6U61_02340 [Thermoplasmata archaeon]
MVSGKYTVLIDERLKKDLDKIPENIIEQLLDILDEFEEDPFALEQDSMLNHLKAFQVILTD